MSRQIVVDIVGDASKFKSATADATRGAGGFGSAIKGVAMGAGIGAWNTALGAASGAVGWFTDSLERGSDQVEALGKVGVIFGDQAKEIEAWASTAATSMGMSKTAALGAAGMYGNLFKAMKLAPGPTKDMSQGLVKLAGDLASFNNMDPTEVLDKLRAGITGEAEPLKSLGVNINEATIKAKALELGLWDGKSALDAGAKAQASYALIMEQTAAAQGDFARTADGAANKSRIAQARMEDLQATIGLKLQPVYLALLDVGGRLIDGFTWLLGAIEPVIAAIATELAPAFQAVSDLIGGTVIPIITQVTEAVLPPLRTILGVIGGVVRTVFGFIARYVSTEIAIVRGVLGGVMDVFRSVSSTIESVASSVGGAVGRIVGFFTGIGGRIGAATRGMWDGIWGAFRGVINAIIGGWNGLKFTIPSIDVPFFGRVGGFTFGTPNIPYLHAGGIVPGIPGSDVLSILQAGELVVPRREAAREVVVNIYGPVYGDNIDDLTRRIAARLRVAG